MASLQELRERAQTLIEALPYLRSYQGQTMVIKYGGAAMVDPALRLEVLKDVVLLRYVGMAPILVHGGGPEISAMMERLGKQAEFVAGLRVSDAETAQIAQMVLVGRTNAEIVSALNSQGGRAVGLNGFDANLLVAERHLEGGVDIGFVGDIVELHPEIITVLAERGYLPVIAPVAVGRDGATYNVNADHAAAQVAAALKASKLIVLSDVRGVLAHPDDPDSVISELSRAQAHELIEQGRISSGMIPKVKACLEALDGGVARCHIIDGRVPHALLMEIFTDVGIGTMVVPG